MIRLGLVGCGRWGRNYVGAALESGVAHVTRIAYRGDPLPRDVDALVVAVHPRDAVEVTIRGLALGLPVMVEKPAGLSLADAERLLDAEQRYKSLVLVAHQHLFAERMEQMREKTLLYGVRDGQAWFGGPGPTRDYSAIWDYGPHAASAALALVGVGVVYMQTRACFSLESLRGNMRCLVGNNLQRKVARVDFGDHHYDGYAPAEPALTRMVRAFARAAMDRGTNDWRFGANWAVCVAKILEAVER